MSYKNASWNEELSDQYANKFIVDKGDINDLSDEALMTAFKGCAIEPRSEFYDDIRRSIRKVSLFGTVRRVEDE